MSEQALGRQTFEDRTITALNSILSKVAEIDKSNTELKTRFEMLEKSISGNLDDLHDRVKLNREFTERLEEKHERKIKECEEKSEAKIKELEDTYSEKISNLDRNQNKMIGAMIFISSVAAFVAKLI
jgi:DNA anti-recombination protein RmuC